MLPMPAPGERRSPEVGLGEGDAPKAGHGNARSETVSGREMQ
jgi:hypothetical protein